MAIERDVDEAERASWLVDVDEIRQELLELDLEQSFDTNPPDEGGRGGSGPRGQHGVRARSRCTRT